MYRPPVAALEIFSRSDWFSDDLPDLLWPLLVVAERGDAAAQTFGEFQTAVASLVTEPTAHRLDGRLTSLEAFPAALRADVLDLRVRFPAAVPPELSTLAVFFPEMPGSWFLAGWADESHCPTLDASLNRLSDSVLTVLGDRHHEALVKFVPLAWTVVSGTGSFEPTVIEVLHDYPSVESKFPMADSIIRASFGALKGLSEWSDTTDSDPVGAWAEAFWRRCWKLVPCMPEENRSSVDAGDDECGTEPSENEVEDALANAAAAAEQSIATAFNEFLDRALSDDLDIDLYRPARFEVVTGILSRAARATLVVSGNPDLWPSEHSAGVHRLLAESEILLRWMDFEGEESFQLFQDYGAGKRKLNQIHLENLAAKLGAAAPEKLGLAIEDQKNRLGGSLLDVQEVNLDSTFAGKSLRQMADECSAMDVYRHVFQPMSAVVHGEWWTIEDYALQRCANPLHRFHRIPSFAALGDADEGTGRILASLFADLCLLASSLLVSQEDEEVS